MKDITGSSECANGAFSSAQIAPEDTEAKGAECKKTSPRRLAELEQMFKGKAMSYFEMAQAVLEYHDIYKRVFAQSVQKAQKGRPGVVSAMARDLTVLPGRTPDARRAWIERALKVARLSPEAKTAAVHAKFDRNRGALIEIAEAGGSVQQLQKIEELKQRTAKRKRQAKVFLKKTVQFPAARGDEIMAKLISFVEEIGIEII
jgi:hypothetical protein